MPADNSLAFKTNFIMTFAKLPKIEFFIQDLLIPAMNLGSIVVPGTRLDWPHPGDKLEFDPLTISFLLDENFDNYLEVYNWMIELRDPLSSVEPNDQTDDALSDCTVTILDNSKNPIIRINFIDCFPNSLDGALFDVSAEGDDPQIGNLTLDYAYYTIEKVL